MKIVLLQEVKGLGKAGEIKDVSEGYARNFLLSKKLASIGSESAIKSAELKKEEVEKRQKEALIMLRELAQKISHEKICIKTKGKSGKLFGAITKKQIAEELKAKNLEISERCIIMKEAIKRAGSYEIEIKLSAEIKARIKLEVSGE